MGSVLRMNATRRLVSGTHLRVPDQRRCRCKDMRRWRARQSSYHRTGNNGPKRLFHWCRGLGMWSAMEANEKCFRCHRSCQDNASRGRNSETFLHVAKATTARCKQQRLTLLGGVDKHDVVKGRQVLIGEEVLVPLGCQLSYLKMVSTRLTR